MASNYQLARDTVIREIIPPWRYGYVNLICYYLNMVERLEGFKPNTFREALESKDSQRWLKMVSDEMYSLMKNHT